MINSQVDGMIVDHVVSALVEAMRRAGKLSPSSDLVVKCVCCIKEGKISAKAVISLVLPSVHSQDGPVTGGPQLPPLLRGEYGESD